MDDLHKVYTLLDKATGEIRYVGKTSCGLLKRMKRHIRDSRTATDYRSRWIRSLNGEIEVCELQSFFSNEDALAAEVYWISFLRTAGCRLTNTTDGGTGLVGLRFSEIHRARISASLAGKMFSPSHKQSLSKSQLKRQPASEETRKKMSSARKRSVLDHLGVQYDSAKEAAEKLNLHRSHVTAVANGVRKSTGGYVFSWA